MSAEFVDLLSGRLGPSVQLSPAQIAQLQEHFELLQRWNKILKLTSIQPVAEIVERHFCESLFLGAHLPPGILKIVDIGSGGGFPGLPIAVLRPECSVTLIESHQRKAVFLREASRKLPNVRVLAIRAQDLTHEFEWAVSRAVKYSEIEPTLGRLVGQVGLLGGMDTPGSKCFTWNAPIQLPWGERRFLWLGTRVPRETS